MAFYAWMDGKITDEEMQQIIGGTAVWQGIPGALKYGPKAFARVPKAVVETRASLPENLNYSETVIERLNDPARYVPQETIKTVIRDGVAAPDPQKTDAIMYYLTVWRNGKPYTMEVLYHHPSNTVWHVMYYEL